ncbi:MAG TPA: exodeoxyribonuclease VII large subunit [Candidatus Coprenecus pullistercoris]|nr:exodeoxyribonuclease VII large subunit [Candidatus Coprenecus pullistercoris]
MREYVSLSRLLQGVKGAVATALPSPVWVKAEIHELRVHANGHCYMELVEKGSGRDVFSAKVSAVIWRSRRPLVEAAFHQGTGRRLEAGMTVLVQVRVQYSELYGMSLSIEDIDPAFTLGEVELARQRTLERLTREGLLDRNGSLPMPGLPRRFALITSETAAGYGDFMNHLYDNGYGFRFYTKLYPAPMQGAAAPAGIMDALNSVLDDLAEGARYDAVLLLRGGGAVADLVCFDDYELAVSIATFPLPVMVAVGHERDRHICDMVAARSLKTPTALADFIVDAFVAEDASLTALSDRLRSSVALRMENLRLRQEQTGRRLQSGTAMRCRLERSRMDMLRMRMKKGAALRSGNEQNGLNVLWMRVRSGVVLRLKAESGRLDMLELRVRKGDPVAALREGSAYVLRAGRPVETAAALTPGDSVDLLLRDGTVRCLVSSVDIN